MNYKYGDMSPFVLLALMLSVLLATTYLLRIDFEPSCGNKLVEEGETPQTCCEDTGCLPSQICINGSCANIGCGYCEYVANNTCHRYECCSDAECGKNETCGRNTNKCVQIECECGYIKNSTCVSYECCGNNDCKSGLCTNHKCAQAEEPNQLVKKNVEKELQQTKQPLQNQQLQETPPQQQVSQLQQQCVPVQNRVCGYNNIGTCRTGTQVCQSNYQWGACTGNIDPSPEICDNNDNDCDGQVDEGSLCPQGQLCSEGSCKTVNSDYKVQPVLVFPTDYPSDQDMIDYLNRKFEEIRQFYLSKAGVTFTMLPTKVINGNNNHEWYWCVDNQAGCEHNNFEANIIKELKDKGLPIHGDWNQVPANRVTWVAAFGGGGWAGGRFYPTGGGFAMLGDAGIYAAKDKSCSRVLDKYHSKDNHPNVKDACQNSWLPSGQAEGFGIGALGHELGHALNLPHPDGYPGTTEQDWGKTLMGHHWNYPNTGLLEQDKERALQSPFFNKKS